MKQEWIRHLILLVSVLPGLFFVRTDEYYTCLGLLIGLIGAMYFEKRVVNFRDTRNTCAMILRIIGSFVLYFVLNTVLKLPFDKRFLASKTMPAFLTRAARYAIIIFGIIGIYQNVFPLFE